MFRTILLAAAQHLIPGSCRSFGPHTWGGPSPQTKGHQALCGNRTVPALAPVGLHKLLSAQPGVMSHGKHSDSLLLCDMETQKD